MKVPNYGKTCHFSSKKSGHDKVTICIFRVLGIGTGILWIEMGFFSKYYGGFEEISSTYFMVLRFSIVKILSCHRSLYHEKH
jgi:hypothetical protein